MSHHAKVSEVLGFKALVPTWLYWAAVKELDLSYHIGEAIVITICIPIMVTQCTFLHSKQVQGLGFRVPGVGAHGAGCNCTHDVSSSLVLRRLQFPKAVS